MKTGSARDGSRRKLAGFLRPCKVIGARFGTGQAFDVTLKERPETNRFEWIVEPAGGDTEEGLVWRHVVNAVMTSREDQVHVLQ